MGINLAVVKFDGSLHVAMTGFDSEKDAKKWFFSESEGAEEVIAFIQVNSEEIEDEDLASAVDAINSLMRVDQMRDAIEHVMTALINTIASPFDKIIMKK